MSVDAEGVVPVGVGVAAGTAVEVGVRVAGGTGVEVGVLAGVDPGAGAQTVRVAVEVTPA